MHRILMCFFFLQTCIHLEYKGLTTVVRYILFYFMLLFSISLSMSLYIFSFSRLFAFCAAIYHDERVPHVPSRVLSSVIFSRK